MEKWGGGVKGACCVSRHKKKLTFMLILTPFTSFITSPHCHFTTSSHFHPSTASTSPPFHLFHHTTTGTSAHLFSTASNSSFFHLVSTLFTSLAIITHHSSVTIFLVFLFPKLLCQFSSPFSQTIKIFFFPRFLTSLRGQVEGICNSYTRPQCLYPIH